MSEMTKLARCLVTAVMAAFLVLASGCSNTDPGLVLDKTLDLGGYATFKASSDWPIAYRIDEPDTIAYAYYLYGDVILRVQFHKDVHLDGDEEYDSEAITPMNEGLISVEAPLREESDINGAKCIDRETVLIYEDREGMIQKRAVITKDGWSIEVSYGNDESIYDPRYFDAILDSLEVTS
jgi:hypothetical protein